MDQIQWMFSLLPDAILNWVYWAIIAVGITGVFAGWFGKFIPVYGRYVEYLKPVGVVLLVLGVWLRGGYDTEMAWRSKVAEAEAKVAKAEEASKEVNAKLEAKIKEKQKVRIEYYNTVKERIVKETQIIDAECKVAPEAINILNDAAKNSTKKGTVTIEEVNK
jgi:type VI protein secretion system component VasK